MDKNKIAPILMVATIVILAAFGVTPVIADGDPGSGCECDTVFYDTIRGGVILEQQGYAQYSPVTKIFTDVPGNIKLARVYTGVWQGSPGKGGYYNITVNAHTTATYKACDPCPQATGCDPWRLQRCDLLDDAINSPWNNLLDKTNMHARTVGCGVQFYSFNATPYVVPGTNTVTVKTEACSDCYRGGWDGRVYLVALLVVYEDPSLPAEITYWINEGALYLVDGSGCTGDADYASKYFYGTHVSSPTNVKLWSLGWPHVINTGDTTGGWTKFNTCTLGNPTITEAYGSNEVLLRWQNIPTSCLDPTSNFLEYFDPHALYERAFAEVLIVEADDRPDIVDDIEFPTVMRPNQPYTIYKTVENRGSANAGPFNVSLKIERGSTTYYSQKKLVAGGLNAHTSTTVSFTGVNLPTAGCYDFTDVVDCDDDVDESDETNNEVTECYQVGNVIVVDGNSGFDALVSEGMATLEGGTYYIEGLTITNCAGDGISIKNTDVPFVISNCHVYDCGVPSSCNKPGNGMLFQNVENGKVTDSEVWGSTLKGIKMVNCRDMVIDNNYVHDNLKYGIDVYMDTMPTIDSYNITISNNKIEKCLYGIEMFCHECNVSGNLILNSTAWSGGEEGWGIYMSGNDSRVYNNTIKYSDSYGMRVDSTWIPTCGNFIIGNDFIDNNQLHAHPSQAFDNAGQLDGNGRNYWNTTEPVGYYYPAPYTSYTSCVGNHWSDYTGSDPDSNGIGVPAYGIDGGAVDDYPRMSLTQSYLLIMCGDLVAPYDVVDTGDVTRLRAHVLRGIPANTWAGDVVAPYGVVDTGDVTRLRAHVLRGIPCNCVIIIDGVIIWIRCPGFAALLAIAAMTLIASYLVRNRTKRRRR